MTDDDGEKAPQDEGETEDDRRTSDDRRADGGSVDDATADDAGADGAADDIPLNIAGHEAEKAERERSNGDSGTDEVAVQNPVPGAVGQNGDSAGDDGAENDAAADDGAADTEEPSVLSKFDIVGANPEHADDEVEPVELLVQLAEDGEIDPWDIDVVRVTDKFLDRLDDADLRTGGRALFYASVLLRMKSDVMWTDDEPEDEWADEPWDAPPEEREMGAEGPVVDPFDELEREMDRRIERKRARGMPETLDELVRDLRERERETWWKESRTYDTSESPSGFSRGTQTLDYRAGDDFRMEDEPTADDVTGTAHDEHMEDIINDVYVELQRHYDQGRDEVLFAEVREAGGSTVNTFLGLLFLAHRGQVRLQQDDLFGDLWVQDPAAVPAEEAAPADD